MKNLITLWLALLCTPVFAQFVHQSTLVGTGGFNTSFHGISVSISADGNVAVVGGEQDSLGRGAAWVYTRTGNQWTQMGRKLIPNGAAGNLIYFGYSTGISADGNTIAIGGYGDNNKRGAVWIFVRNGNVWLQQGAKLVGNQATGTTVFQGSAISLSADGNTLLLGAEEDFGGRGSAWVFQRTGSTWAQQGNKISISPNNGWYFGVSVSLSADGNTALIGAPLEIDGTVANRQGYCYLYRRTGNTWNFVQRITDTSISNSRFGEGVALSGNGMLAAIGGPSYSNQNGVISLFRYNPTTQQWGKESVLNPPGATIGARFGRRISISKGGDTLAASGYLDNNDEGAVWIFTHSNGNWTPLGSKITVPNNGGSSPYFGRSLSLTADGKILLIGRPGGLFPGSAFIYTDPRISLNAPENIIQQELRLYPNPVQNFLHLPAGISYSHLTISDLSGKVLLQQAKPNYRLDLSSFSAGIYIVSLHQQDKVQHVRVVKE